LGWWQTLSTELQSEVWQSIVSEHEPLHHQLIDVALQSDAIWGIAPLQDWLGLGSEARFNTPGTSIGNWGWRLTNEQLAHLNPRIVRDRLQFSNRLPFRFQTQTHNQGVAK
jgi:4-alpha-glucanotransferase